MRYKNRRQKKISRQLIGFILLILVFAVLLYTAFSLFNEGKLFSQKYENKTAITKKDSEMTYVTIIYKQNTENSSR